MEQREFNRVVDRYLKEGKMSVDDYEALDDLQKYWVQTTKRAFKRINKAEVETIHHSLTNNE